MRFSFFIALFVCLLFACRRKEQIPPGIIPINRMKVLVWDMEVADQQAADRFQISKDSLRMESTSLYQQVFAKHKTSKADFYKSFAFYEAHPNAMRILFDSVSNYGSRQKAAAYKKVY